MGNMMTKEELREIINPLFKNLSDKIDHISEMSGKDIKTLFKQSGEHYKEAEKLDEKLQQEIEKTTKKCDESIMRLGGRVGDVEKSQGISETKIIEIEKDISDASGNKKFHLEMWIVVALFIGQIIFDIING